MVDIIYDAANVCYVCLWPKLLVVLEDFAVYLVDISLLFFSISKMDLKAMILHANNIQQNTKHIALLSICKSEQEQLDMYKY